MNPIRAKAIDNGDKQYFTGRPCRLGHISNRYCSNGICIECMKILNANNKDKRRESVRLWRLKNLEECRKYDRDRYPLIAEKKRKERKIRYWSNPDKERRYNREWRKKNPELFHSLTKQWRDANPERMAALYKANGALRRKAEGKHTADDILDILKTQNSKCAYCRIKLTKEYHVDHIIPITRGGTNHRKNLQILCIKCNKSKYNHDPIKFAQSLGLML